MFSFLKNALVRKNETNWFWGIALFALCIELCFHALLPVSISNDTYGYLDLSRRLFNPNTAFERSVGYPLLLGFSGIHIFDSVIPIMLIQAGIAVSIPLLVFRCLTRFGLGYAVLGALIACLYFYNFVLSLSVLTELFYVFSIAVYAWCMIQYFSQPTQRNLLLVVAACWFIALVRVSGSMHFISLLAGIGVFILLSLIHKRRQDVQLGLRHFAIAAAVFICTSLVYGLITNRTSSVVWPHFVFNWTYKDSPTSGIQYGIIKPENGPAAQRLFSEIEKVVAEHPNAFDTLKAGGSDKVKALKPRKDGKYDAQAVKLLMDDLINNNKHDLRSWWIEGVLVGHGHGIVGTSELLGDAIIEGFKTHPGVILKRFNTIVYDRIAKGVLQGIDLSNVSFPTSYHHQIHHVVNQPPPESLKPGMYKQWTYDLYNHTGNDPINRQIDYPQKYPNTLAAAMENVRADNLIGVGHYIGMLGTQVIRLCWLFIGIGLVFFLFSRHAPLLGGLLSASILPPVASVFLSETDPRHLLMTSPVHIVAGVLVLYAVVELFKRSGYAR